MSAYAELQSLMWAQGFYRALKLVALGQSGKELIVDNFSLSTKIPMFVSHLFPHADPFLMYVCELTMLSSILSILSIIDTDGFSGGPHRCHIERD